MQQSNESDLIHHIEHLVRQSTIVQANHDTDYRSSTLLSLERISTAGSCELRVPRAHRLGTRAGRGRREPHAGLRRIVVDALNGDPVRPMTEWHEGARQCCELDD